MGVIAMSEPNRKRHPSVRPGRAVRMFPGTPVSVERARAFVSRALAGCPARETLITCVSELCTNAIAHTRSGAGGVFTVEVSYPATGTARVAVTDSGSPGLPRRRALDGDVILPPDQELDENGRGLALVAALTSRWGHHPLPGGGRVVWAEATWPIPVPA
jgi:anti-sigma regulatory factor (Ser/Thr protein kinase)